MEKIDLVLPREEERCEVFVGLGVIDYLVDDLKNRPLADRLAVITDQTVEKLFGDRLHRRLTDAGIRTDLIAIEPGEETKRWESLQGLFEALVESGLDRRSGLIALGGGVVGDVTGFVASVYMRSIPYVQVPTTLLAQVDSSLGGKNGIDLSHGKNLLGTIYQPRRVYIDPSFLARLPDDEFRNGLAEVVKTAVVRRRDLFLFLEDRPEAVLDRQDHVLEEMVRSCCRIKVDIVMKDERDTGVRQILNFGHTVGHAIEACSGYRVAHGAAVSMGMAVETVCAATMEIVAAADKKRILNLMKRYGLPVQVPEEWDLNKVLQLMALDKKASGGRITMAFPTAIGEATIVHDVPKQAIQEALQEVQA